MRLSRRSSEFACVEGFADAVGFECLDEIAVDPVAGDVVVEDIEGGLIGINPVEPDTDEPHDRCDNMREIEACFGCFGCASKRSR